ncbi:MAG: START domain-containing protein [Candidatus Rokuibacteriota bacterium]
MSGRALRGRLSSLLPLGLLVVGVVLPVGSAYATEWQMLSEKNGMLVERRAHPGSGFYEVRATTNSALPPAAIFETIWRQREHPQFVPYLKQLDLLADTGDEHLSYEQVAVPLARDRDYTVRLRKRVDQEAQRYEVVFAIANEAGPPPDGSHVRVAHIRGRWLIEPGRDGTGARVIYEVLSEPGGAIPSWVANRVQGEAAASLVRAILQRTHDRNGHR